jgi:hypothetical protein
LRLELLESIRRDRRDHRGEHQEQRARAHGFSAAMSTMRASLGGVILPVRWNSSTAMSRSRIGSSTRSVALTSSSKLSPPPARNELVATR